MRVGSILFACSLLFLTLAPLGCGGGDDTPEPDAAAGGGIQFLQSCDPADDQCADGLMCFEFNMKGPHCTHSCQGDGDCEAPSPGCNGQNVCKAP